jgi:hypothetical protein
MPATAAEARAQVDVDRRYLSKIETCTTSVGLDIIGRLAAVLEVEPHELLIPPPRRRR